MTRYLVAYLVTLVAFVAIDLGWLGFVAVNFYRSRLGPLMLDKPNLLAAALFYLLFPVGIVVFAEERGFATQSLGAALGFGALFGLLAYATYDLSNWATLKGYPADLAATDMAWGTVLTAVSAAVGYLVASRVG